MKQTNFLEKMNKLFAWLFGNKVAEKNLEDVIYEQDVQTMISRLKNGLNVNTVITVEVGDWDGGIWCPKSIELSLLDASLRWGGEEMVRLITECGGKTLNELRAPAREEAERQFKIKKREAELAAEKKKITDREAVDAFLTVKN